MLTVNQIFYSIQGESTHAGFPCVFIRLAGCNLRCTYCDTQYAFNVGKDYSMDEILNQVSLFDCGLVEITGGEPLLQKETPNLARNLIDRGYTLLVETNGSQNIDLLPEEAVRIMDLKCPGSGQNDRTDWNNIDRLKPKDEVKLVMVSRFDYEWARSIVSKHRLNEKATILFSPAHGKLPPAQLADWILEDRLSVRLQIQLHKIIWPSSIS